METNDKFKNSPIHDKVAILKLMDELSPAQMVKTVDFMRRLRESINSDAQGESRNVSQNEQTKEDFSHERMLHPAYRHMNYKYCPKCGIDISEKTD